MRTKLLLLFTLFTLLSNSQTVTTLAGSSAGSADGTGTSATFNRPWGVAVDASGNVYVADELNHKIRKITTAGVVTTFAGSTSGYQDGNGTSAKFNSPNGLAFDSFGNLFVVDCYNHRIRKITPSGDVTTFAGSVQGAFNGNGTVARFNFPQGIAIDSSNNLFIVDGSNNIIRKITPSGDVTTFAGTAGVQAYVDGTGSDARFGIVKAIGINRTNNDMFVTDGHRIRKITSAGVVTTYSGSTNGLVNGTLTASKYFWPEGIVVTTSGDVYVGDSTNCVIRKLSASGTVTTLCGNSNGIVGSADGTGNAASFYSPKGLCFDSSGNNLYVADSNNHRIRKIDMSALSTNYFNLETIGIYPNPVTTILNISLENNSEVQKVEIYDLTGKKVKFYEGNTTSIHVGDLTSGFYILEVTIDGKKDSKKFIKQ